MFSETKIRCLLVHDHVLLRQGLRRLFEDEPDLEVVGEAGSNVEALHSIFALRPDVVIADPSALGLVLLDMQRWILQESPHTQVLFLTSDQQKPMQIPVRGLPELGRAARETSVQELVAMVRRACLPKQCGMLGDDDSSQTLMQRNRTLTTREKEVLKLLAEGGTVRSVARSLGLSTKTVDAHKFNLMRKLGVHNKTELVLWAIQQHLVKVPAMPGATH